jgi:hypothetical protein
MKYIALLVTAALLAGCGVTTSRRGPKPMPTYQPNYTNHKVPDYSPEYMKNSDPRYNPYLQNAG